MKPKNRIALPIATFMVAALIVFALSSRRSVGSDSATNPSGTPAAPPASNGAISPQDEADALHFVIAADREMYCRVFIAHQKEGGSSLDLSAGSKSGESWPLPEELFRGAAESIQSKGAEFSYALRSLRPIDPRNGPQTELEQRGLAFIASHPSQNYYGQEMLGGRHYFTAVYPDIPAVAACVGCHNRGSSSNPQRSQVGDILGGIVVRVPLEF
jgi:hypothetical protein